MKLSDYVANEISKETGHIFVGNGGVVVHLLHSLNKTPIKIIPMQHEQGAAMAADAYGRLTGLGVCLATSGPGFLNLLQGTASSYYDSIPVLTIVGAVPTAHFRKTNVRQYGFQEMQVCDIVKSFTKYAVRINSPTQIMTELSKCIKIAKEGRPGPTLIEIPDDLQRFDLKEGATSLPELLANSKNIVIIAGYGVRISGTAEQVKRLAKDHNATILPTWGAIDLFPTAPRIGIMGSKEGNILLQNADLVIALGTRLDTHVAGSDYNKFAPKAKKVMVDIDSGELDRELDLPINKDLKDFFNELY